MRFAISLLRCMPTFTFGSLFCTTNVPVASKFAVLCSALLLNRLLLALARHPSNGILFRVKRGGEKRRKHRNEILGSTSLPH